MRHNRYCTSVSANEPACPPEEDLLLWGEPYRALTHMVRTDRECFVQELRYLRCHQLLHQMLHMVILESCVINISEVPLFTANSDFVFPHPVSSG